MLQWLAERTRMGKIIGLWSDATQLNPGDSGQVAVMASRLIKVANMRAEDAWLSALTNWAHNHPDPEARFVLATALLRFLDIYGYSAGLSPECREATRSVAENLASANAIFNPAFKKIEPAESQFEQDKNRQQEKRTLQTGFPPASGDKISGFSTATQMDQLSKDEAYKLALEFLSVELWEREYLINMVAEERGDIPSLVVEKEGRLFHILLHLDFWPIKSAPPPFLVSTCLDGKRPVIPS